MKPLLGRLACTNSLGGPPARDAGVLDAPQDVKPLRPAHRPLSDTAFITRQIEVPAAPTWVHAPAQWNAHYSRSPPRARTERFQGEVAAAGGILSPEEQRASRKIVIAMARSTLIMRIEPQGWGDAHAEEIAAVLDSAASELIRHIPELPPIPILVEPTDRHPFTLYGRSQGNEHVVRLSAKDRHWYQFAYEFSHELCHILCDHARYRYREERWFEESLCELASVFTLKRMAVSWRRSPPYPDWADHASDLQEYVDDLLEESHRQLPADMQLKDWYRVNAEWLRLNPWDREKNELVASRLLPAFEDEPEAWGAVPYLSPSGCRPVESFELYLAGWLRRTPDPLRRFVRAVAEEFGMAPDATA